MSVRILRSRDYPVLAWKNGLGVSQVIASDPPGAGYDALNWQVGTTDIASDCPFSSLPGFDRQFMLLDGEGVELHCYGADADPDVRRRIDAPLQPFAFRGDWHTDCMLIGAPVRVFNVLTRRGRFSAEVSVSTGSKSVALETPADESLLVFVAEGTVRIDGGSVSLAVNDAIIADGTALERYSIDSPSARVVIVRLNEVRQGAGQ